MISKKSIFLTALLVALLTLSGCGKIRKFPTQKLTVETDAAKYELTVEVADEPAERQQGYMNRKKIGENQGMWFVFQGEDVRKFWMKNTKVALDILFVNKKLEIRGMVKKAQPCTQDPCPTYDSPPGIQYTLEVPEGFIDAKGIQIGDRILLPSAK